MSTRWITVFLIAAACEPPASAPAPKAAAAEPSKIALKPTPRQEKALANPLHKAHMEAEEEPTECRDCHRIQGEDAPTKIVKHRCLSCHEDQRSALHANVANGAARECLSCHEFFESTADPWACTACHEPQSVPTADHRPATDGDQTVSGKARRSVLTELFGAAPPVRVHEKDCKACHVPHGKEALAPTSCLECHEDQTAKHASADPKGLKSLAEPDQCMECHGGHVPATAARAECASCHKKTIASTALFEGHGECVECHQPHGKVSKKSCTSCHSEQQTIAADLHPEHAKCLNCHEPHTVHASARQNCAKCHEDQAVLAKTHPPDEKKGVCVGCHPQHPLNDRLTLATTCSSCHEEAKSDDALHAGATCKSCHLPHAFGLKTKGVALCADCHLGDLPRHPKPEVAKAVFPTDGHEQCSDCHEKVNHAPTPSMKIAQTSCGRCHEPQRSRVSKDHSRCLDCHTPHEGRIWQDCLACHDDKAKLGRHKPNRQDCEGCHSIHASPQQEAPPCVSCHEPPLPLMHQNEGHTTCADCHTFHQETKGGDRMSCLDSCHKELRDHEPAAKRCIGCHPFVNDAKEVRR